MGPQPFPADLPARPDWAMVEAAARRLAPHLHRTPILSSAAIDELAGCSIRFKCENFQKTGSFKARGAYNAVLSIADEAAPSGVVTHSSGNHAAALAAASRARGIPAHVVMPRTAPEVKKAAVRHYGGRIVECEPTLAAREAAAARLAAETGASFIPPFDHSLVIAGQGTAAAELLVDCTDPLDAILCPVGGGGLLGGTALAARALRPGIAVIATEPALADDAAEGFQTGRMAAQRLPVTTMADGLTTAMSPLTFGLMQDLVDDVLTVSEEAIIEAMRLVWTRMKILIEPSCAVPLAAVLARPARFSGQRLGLILTGGNVDLDRLPWVAR